MAVGLSAEDGPSAPVIAVPTHNMNLFPIALCDLLLFVLLGGLGEDASRGGCRWSALKGEEGVLAAVALAVVAGAEGKDEGRC